MIAPYRKGSLVLLPPNASVPRKQRQEKSLCGDCIHYAGLLRIRNVQTREWTPEPRRPSCRHPQFLNPVEPDILVRCSDHNGDGTCPFYDPGIIHRILQFFRLRPKAWL